MNNTHYDNEEQLEQICESIFRETINEGIWDRTVAKASGAMSGLKQMGQNARNVYDNYKNRNDPNYVKKDTTKIGGIYNNQKFTKILQQYIKKIIKLAIDLDKFLQKIKQPQQNGQK